MTEATCPGCGWIGPEEDGPVHPYMTASPACWRRFNAIMAREYENPGLMPTHFYSVDAYAAQHPGDPEERRARQSVWIHLAGLHAVLREGRDPAYRYALLRRLADAADSWPVPPAHASFPIVAGTIPPDLPETAHGQTMRDWAEATLAAYEVANADLAKLMQGLG